MNELYWSADYVSGIKHTVSVLKGNQSVLTKLEKKVLESYRSLALVKRADALDRLVDQSDSTLFNETGHPLSLSALLDNIMEGIAEEANVQLTLSERMESEVVKPLATYSASYKEFQAEVEEELMRAYYEYKANLTDVESIEKRILSSVNKLNKLEAEIAEHGETEQTESVTLEVPQTPPQVPQEPQRLQETRVVSNQLQESLSKWKSKLSSLEPQDHKTDEQIEEDAHALYSDVIGRAEAVLRLQEAYPFPLSLADGALSFETFAEFQQMCVAMTREIKTTVSTVAVLNIRTESFTKTDLERWLKYRIIDHWKEKATKKTQKLSALSYVSQVDVIVKQLEKMKLIKLSNFSAKKFTLGYSFSSESSETWFEWTDLMSNVKTFDAVKLASAYADIKVLVEKKKRERDEQKEQEPQIEVAKRGQGVASPKVPSDSIRKISDVWKRQSSGLVSLIRNGSGSADTESLKHRFSDEVALFKKEYAEFSVAVEELRESRVALESVIYSTHVKVEKMEAERTAFTYETLKKFSSLMSENANSVSDVYSGISAKMDQISPETKAAESSRFLKDSAPSKGGLYMIDSLNNNHTERVNVAISSVETDLKVPTVLFGVDLNMTATTEGSSLPLFVHSVIETTLKDSKEANREAWTRPYDLGLANRLHQLFSKQKNVSIETYVSEITTQFGGGKPATYELVTALKLWLLELSSPVIPHQAYEELEISYKKGIEDTRAVLMRTVQKDSGRVSCATLAYLVQYFLKIMPEDPKLKAQFVKELSSGFAPLPHLLLRPSPISTEFAPANTEFFKRLLSDLLLSSEDLNRMVGEKEEKFQQLQSATNDRLQQQREKSHSRTPSRNLEVNEGLKAFGLASPGRRSRASSIGRPLSPLPVIITPPTGK